MKKKQTGGTSPILNLDLSRVIYLLFRMFPLILPSYFILSSIFSADMKGVIYLAGLLFAVVTTILSANMFDNLFKDKFFFDIEALHPTASRTERCEVLTLTDSAPLSPLAPLSQVVYSYTFWYFIYIIWTYHLWTQNVITVILFGILIIGDWVWNVYNQCNTVSGVALSLFVGSMWGYLWAFLIDRSGAVKLQYFNGLSNRTVCSRPSSTTFVCSDTSS